MRHFDGFVKRSDAFLAFSSLKWYTQTRLVRRPKICRMRGRLREDEESVKESLKKLWHDERPFRQRLLTALLTGFAVSFSFVIVGIFDLYMNNIGLFPFDMASLAGPVILCGLLCMAAITLVCVLVKGEFYDILISLFLGILLAGYLQGNFLNLDLGELTGDKIDWSQYTTHSFINGAVWAVLIVVPMLILIFSEGVWKKLTIILPVLLIGMQLAGLVSTAVTTDFSQETKLNVSNDTAEAEAFVSDKGIFELSSKDNILVFILDRLDGKYIDSVVADDPHFFDDMEGFTYFPNNTSLYCRTYPADLYLLTGKISYYDQPANELFTQAYSEGRFLPSLRARDYTTKLYIAKYYAYSDVSQLQGLADNVVTEKQEQKVDKLRMLQAMAQFSAYRYTPHAMKQYFWLSAQTFSDTVVITNENNPSAGDSYSFGDELKKKGVSLTEEKNNFMFLHLKGCHGNYDLDAQGNYVGDGNSTLLEQTKGYFTLLKQYMEQMKALGVYDSSTIIITGDHGKSEDVRSLDTYKTTGLFVKPAGSSSGTLQTSSRPLSQTNFHATVLQAAGINSDEYGKSIWEVGEEEDVVRRFLYKVNKKALEEYEIRGDAEDFSNWTHVKDYPLTYDH